MTKEKSKILSNREKEILNLFAEGKRPKEISELLFLSYFTVRTHQTNIIQTLNASGITHAVSIAIRMGLI